MSDNEQKSEVRLFTRDEIKSRTTRDDVVLIIHNSVYNVTKFLEEHPGGEEVLLEQAGKDSTEPFEDVSHSSDARSLMEKYKIGELVPAERTENQLKDGKWSTEPREPGNSWTAWLAPLVLGLAATVLYRFLFS